MALVHFCDNHGPSALLCTRRAVRRVDIPSQVHQQQQQQRCEACHSLSERHRSIVTPVSEAEDERDGVFFSANLDQEDEELCLVLKRAAVRSLSFESSSYHSPRGEAAEAEAAAAAEGGSLIFKVCSKQHFTARCHNIIFLSVVGDLPFDQQPLRPLFRVSHSGRGERQRIPPHLRHPRHRPLQKPASQAVKPTFGSNAESDCKRAGKSPISYLSNCSFHFSSFPRDFSSYAFVAFVAAAAFVAVVATFIALIVYARLLLHSIHFHLNRLFPFCRCLLWKGSGRTPQRLRQRLQQ